MCHKKPSRWFKQYLPRAHHVTGTVLGEGDTMVTETKIPVLKNKRTITTTTKPRFHGVYILAPPVTCLLTLLVRIVKLRTFETSRKPNVLTFHCRASAFDILLVNYSYRKKLQSETKEVQPLQSPKVTPPWNSRLHLCQPTGEHPWVQLSCHLLCKQCWLEPSLHVWWYPQ